MENEGFDVLLDKSLRFARLHSWCDQTEAEIEAVLGFVSNSPENQEYYRASVLARLDGTNTLEEKLVSLVYLRFLDVPALRIAELFYIHLNSKLTKRDTAFISAHFFDGQVPIPLEISKEITDRVFLTYHRAIYQALQIQSFESDFNQENTMLFLVQLLCRNNLYDQNRAIIFLLLSRIETPLPPMIEEMALSAMEQLSDVIKDVERRQDSVFSDSYSSSGSENAQLNWSGASTSVPPSAVHSPRQIPQATNSGFWKNGMESGSPVSEGGQKRSISRNEASIPVQNAPLSEGDPYEPPDSGQKQPHASEKKTKAQVPGHAGESAPETALVPEIKTSKAGVEHKRESDMVPTEGAADSDTPGYPDASRSRTAPASAHERYVINFSRTTKELSHLLETLEETVAASPSNLTNSAALVSPPKSARRRNWVWLFVTLGLLFLAAGVYFSVHSDQPGTSTVTVATVAQSAKDQTKSDPSLRSENGAMFWQPAKGETLWVLFTAIRQGSISFKGSAELTSSGWQTFLSRLAERNPELTVPDLIYPHQKIRLIP